MKLLITSDVHGRSDLLHQVIEKHKDVDVHINAGDMCLAPNVLNKFQVITVSGNNDYNRELPNERLLEFNGLKIWLTHGHLEHVKLGLERLKQKALKEAVHVCVFGHTHKQYLNVHHKIIFINPGSLGDGSKSYALYENGKVSFHTV